MKKLLSLVLALLMMTAASTLAEQAAEAPGAQTEAPGAQAQAAVKALRPDASIDYALLDYDDGRYEWLVFFSQEGALGCDEVDSVTFQVLRSIEFSSLPQNALNAAQAIEILTAAKGEITITDLELERDDGSLVYEGEADLGGRSYDFEITVDGQIIEWERD